MSTRGLMGIKKNGKLKAQYNHYDSYIEGLGKYIIETINKLEKDKRIEILSKTYDNIIMIKEDEETSEEIKNYCVLNNVTNLIVSNRTLNDNYCLLHGTQGNLELYLNGFKYMLDGADFLEDELFCEYAYIINLDKNTLEITFGWKNRITKSYDLLNLNYEEIKKEINKIEQQEYDEDLPF